MAASFQALISAEYWPGLDNQNSFKRVTGQFVGNFKSNFYNTVTAWAASNPINQI